MPHTLERPPSAPVIRVRKLASYAASTRVLWGDRVARWVICSFGVLVLLSVALILVFVGKEAAPLFTAPQSEVKPVLKLPVPPETHMLTWSVDDFQTYSYGLGDDGKFYFISNKDGTLVHQLPLLVPPKERVVKAWTIPSGDVVVAVTDSGKFQVVRVLFKSDYDVRGDQILTPRISTSDWFPVGGAGAAPWTVLQMGVSMNSSAETLALAFALSDGRFVIGNCQLMTKTVETREIQPSLEGGVTAISIDSDSRFMTVATDANHLYRWDFESSPDQAIEDIRPSAKGSHVTRIALLLGNFTHILGYADGSVEAWFNVRLQHDSPPKFTRIRSFQGHDSSVNGIVPSAVQRSFWTFDERGDLKMHFNPSARRLYDFQLHAPLTGVAPNGHLNGISVLLQDGRIAQWAIRNPHPDITLKTLFGKIWYEGYSEPKYIWQSSSGSDNFEAKFSMVPLMFGTFKGAFFGLIFAIPVAVLAALYTSQLMHPRMRSVIKPTIEIMAALPSVVIGFLAGLWIAPFLEKHLIASVLVFPMFVTLILIAAWAYFRIPLQRRSHIPQEVEIGIMLGAVALSLFFSQMLATPVENIFFQGNIQQWVYDNWHQKVEQRNSLVIGLAMGFAVIPIIFSISEDALSNVPRHYVSGSLALGATRWQSAVRVILPTASPGIFSAIMLGLGRAVGETMIVLMATGNTPILSFSPFNGMRTLSANIAVEIPEAPVGGSLYRVLFFGAILLFLLTFVVNTVAEVIRMRLRDRYRAL